jgi:hypothetical protein
MDAFFSDVLSKLLLVGVGWCELGVCSVDCCWLVFASDFLS